MIKLLYIAGLLLALIPHHQGRADELQQKAVFAFDRIRKVNVPYLMFRRNFQDSIDVLEATGIAFPDSYVRLKFINAMLADPLYKVVMIPILAHHPAYNLIEIQTRLLGLATTLNDNTARVRSANNAEDSTASTSNSTTSTPPMSRSAQRRAKRALKAADTVALAASTTTPTTQKKHICFTTLDGKECKKTDCHFRHTATKQEKDEALKFSKLQACRSMRDTRTCPRDSKCRFSHDGKIIDAAQGDGFVGHRG